MGAVLHIVVVTNYQARAGGGTPVSHTIEISDEAYRKLERIAAESHIAPALIVEGFIDTAAGTTQEYHYYELDEWFRHLGMTDDEIAEADAELEAEEATDADPR